MKSLIFNALVCAISILSLSPSNTIPFSQQDKKPVIQSKKKSKKKPRKEEICNIADMPAGWVCVAINPSCMGCCGAGTGRFGKIYTIEKIDTMPVGTSMSVCIKDNLPSGWAVTATTECIGCCGAKGAERIPVFTIKRIS